MATRTASRLRRFTIVAEMSGLVLATLGRGRAYAETHDYSQTYSSTQSATYYVSPNGSDSAAGTLASPWRTIQKAASTLQPGQTAIVAAGNYGERVRGENSGEGRKSINLQGAKGGDAHLWGFVIFARRFALR